MRFQPVIERDAGCVSRPVVERNVGYASRFPPDMLSQAGSMAPEIHVTIEGCWIVRIRTPRRAELASDTEPSLKVTRVPLAGTILNRT